MVKQGFSQEKLDKAKDTAKISIALSQEIINPTTLMWQLQLEENAIFTQEVNNNFTQNFRIRLVIPIEKGILIKVPQLIRVIGYINTDAYHTTGLGDLAINQFFILLKKKWGAFGAGWDLNIPTGTPKELSSNQFSIGPSTTLNFSNLGKWQVYFVWQNYFSISKNKEYDSHQTSIIQPNIFYTYSNVTYIFTEPLWTYDYINKTWTVPLNIRFGYVFQTKKYKYNVYIEPEWMTYRSEGAVTNNNNSGMKFGFRIFFDE